METRLQEGIFELSLRMGMLGTARDNGALTAGLSDREKTVLLLLNQRGKMTVSQIASAAPDVHYSTISATITRLWRDEGLVSKKINPESQRETIVELTEKGRQVARELLNERRARFRALVRAIAVTDEEKEILLRVVNRAIAFFDKHLSVARGRRS